VRVRARSERAPAAALRDAERLCERLARRHAANFYWGFVVLPRDQRAAICALYDFAREVDDAADAAGRPPLAAALHRHRERARASAAGRPADPVGLVLAEAMRRYGIPESDLQALIDGVATDLTRVRCATWLDLERYCRLVAASVGRMCVRVFGYRDPSALRHADDLGIALQLTNVLRDVREDGDLGRVYLPAEDMDRFGVGEAGLLAGRPGAGWEGLVAFEAARARDHFARGLRVRALIPRRASACVATMAGIYQGVLGMIERDPGLPLRRRASLSAAGKAAVLVRAWATALG
jgi:phytoene synthase